MWPADSEPGGKRNFLLQRIAAFYVEDNHPVNAWCIGPLTCIERHPSLMMINRVAIGGNDHDHDDIAPRGQHSWRDARIASQVTEAITGVIPNDLLLTDRSGVCMSKNYSELTRDISSGVRAINEAVPDVMAGFRAMSGAATADGILDEKTKELIALAIGVATHCDGCIGFHCRTLAKLGAQRAEVMETLAVAIYMGGGPSLMYAADAVHAFDEFAIPANKG